MNIIVKTVLIIFTFLNVALVHAQSYKHSSDNKRAVKYYDNAVKHYNTGDNENALKNLIKATSADSNFIEAWFLMGDIYYDAGFLSRAVRNYTKALKIDSTFFPGAYYLIGGLFYDLAKYDSSELFFRKYLTFSELSPEMVDLAYDKLEKSKVANLLVSSPVSNKPINIGYPVNTQNDEYINYVNPAKNKLIFTKKTPENTRKRYKEQLYTSERSEMEWKSPTLIDIDWRDERYNMGTINFSTDGRVMYFTGCYWPSGYGNCDIYSSIRFGDRWQIPKNLGDKINTQGWDSQPVISSDGKRLYFASKREGGKVAQIFGCQLN